MQKLFFYLFLQIWLEPQYITMQQTSKWDKHLPSLHVVNLRVHNSVSENYKNSNKIPAHGRYLG